MGKIAFIFSGQGSQYPGMCKDIFTNYSEAEEALCKLDAIHNGLIDLIFSSTEDELKRTENTQLALYAAEIMISTLLRKRGIHPDGAAGFSLGEIAALETAGAINAEDGMRIIEKRACLMQKAAEKHDAAMFAVLKLSDETVGMITHDFSNAYPVNYNAPGQVVVSVAASEADAFERRIKESGGRAMKLNVSGGFHSPFMDEAAEGFRKAISEEVFRSPMIPIWSNLTGRRYGENIKEMLPAQINNPVRWKDEIEDMSTSGFDTFIEIGPGKTLINLVKRILPDAHLMNASSAEDIELILKEIPR